MSNTTNRLTQCSVSTQLLRYAVPVVSTSMLQAVYSIVDILVVSQMLGPSGVSGVNNASQLTILLTQVAIGLANGGSVLVGQYFGAGQKERQDRTVGTFFSLFFLLGAVCSLGSRLAARPFLLLMGAPALEEAAAYLSVAAWGLFFVFLYNAQAGVLRALGNSKAPLRCILTSTVLNIILDLLFVGPLKLGTAGAALATVLAQIVAFLMALFYLLRHRDIFSWAREQLTLKKDVVLGILRIGIPAAVQMTIVGLSWLVVTYFINDYGIIWSAGSGLAGKVKDFTMMFITSLSTAAGSMIAQNLGAREYDRAKTTLNCAMKIALIMSVFLILLVELTAPGLMSIFTDEADVIEAGVVNLRIEVPGQIFYAVFLTYHALMLGAGDTHWMLLSSCANCLVARIILTVIFENLFQVYGIFIACAIAPIVSVPVGVYYTRSGRWRKQLNLNQVE